MRPSSQRFLWIAALSTLLCAPSQVAAQGRGTDSAAAMAKTREWLVRLAKACPGGKRTPSEQSECQRVIDSAQSARRTTLERLRLDAASELAGNLLLDDSFVADDDGRPVPSARWVRIGTVGGSVSGERAPLDVNVQSSTPQRLVGALWTASQMTASLALRLDCANRQALVIRVQGPDDLDVQSKDGIGPWYPATKPRAALTAILKRACP